MSASAQRAYVERGRAEDSDGFKESLKGPRNKWSQANPEKRWAHGQVAYAIRTGRLVRPGVCAHCAKACKPEASHTDYSRPLDVEWLCRQCHAAKDAGWSRSTRE